jgi:hypothetical protein
VTAVFIELEVNPTFPTTSGSFLLPERKHVFLTFPFAASRFHDGIMTLKGRMFYLLAVAFSRQPSAWEQMLSDRTERTVLMLIEAGQRNP